jgi:hypothetical protein
MHWLPEGIQDVRKERYFYLRQHLVSQLGNCFSVKAIAFPIRARHIIHVPQPGKISPGFLPMLWSFASYF